MAPPSYDHDWLVIGSGFGGSVSALRLAEKGYSVGVLECGSRFEDEDFAESAWNLRRYFFSPRWGMRGIFRMTLFRDLFVISGSGVGGGSLGYANTLYVPSPGSAFYRDPQWSGLAEWERELQPHYATAERMLGVSTYEGEGPGSKLLRQLADELGVGHTHTNTPVGVYFGEPGVTVSDPYFGGEGPDRTGCVRCGACMVGCRYGAKNTLMKNYLYFAERAGASIMPERMVVDIRPLDAADGGDGYEVTTERSGAWVRRDRRVHTARGVVMAAGALGTNQLLMECRRRGSLPRLSERVGRLVRTNSEAISAVTVKGDSVDFSKGIAITSSFYPDPDTHIENVTYGSGADAIGLMFTLIAGRGTRLTRPLKAIGSALRHPLQWARTIVPRRWSRRTVILLTMQSLDNHIRLRPRRRLLGRRVRLQSEEDPERPNPRFIPAADWSTRRAAEILDGVPQINTTEAMLNVPTTAHILGGAVIGADASSGVVDSDQRVFGYRNLLVCDGASIPANVGVNPSLTITALAERTMSRVPDRGAAADADRDAAVAQPLPS